MRKNNVTLCSHFDDEVHRARSSGMTTACGLDYSGHAHRPTYDRVTCVLCRLSLDSPEAAESKELLGV